MTEDEEDIAAVRFLEQQGHHDARALLLAIGESVARDEEGYCALHKQSAGFRRLPRDLYDMRFPVDGPLGAGVRVKLTEKGQRVYAKVQSRIGKRR